ncbi:MAG: hypothetical protein WCO33_02270 [bacterium]
MEYYFEKLGKFDESKPLVLIDFDHTISDFTLVKQAIKANCVGIGIKATDWDQSYLDVTTDLHVVKMDEQIKILSQRFNIEEPKVHDAFYTELDNCFKYLFPDVIPFLEKYSNSNNFVLFTLGAEKFQINKRKSSGIDKYLKGAIYTLVEKDLWMFNQLEEKENNKLMVKCFDMSFPSLTVIDDRPSSFDKFTNTYNDKLKLIRLRRVGGRYESEEDIVKTEDIKSLSDVKIL